MESKQIVHDLALVHAKMKYEEFFNDVSVENRPFGSDINELVNFYTCAVANLSSRINEINSVYSNDDGSPIYSFE